MLRNFTFINTIRIKFVRFSGFSLKFTVFEAILSQKKSLLEQAGTI